MAATARRGHHQPDRDQGTSPVTDRSVRRVGSRRRRAPGTRSRAITAARQVGEQVAALGELDEGDHGHGRDDGRHQDGGPRLVPRTGPVGEPTAPVRHRGRWHGHGHWARAARRHRGRTGGGSLGPHRHARASGPASRSPATRQVRQRGKGHGGVRGEGPEVGRTAARGRGPTWPGPPQRPPCGWPGPTRRGRRAGSAPWGRARRRRPPRRRARPDRASRDPADRADHREQGQQGERLDHRLPEPGQQPEGAHRRGTVPGVGPGPPGQDDQEGRDDQVERVGGDDRAAEPGERARWPPPGPRPGRPIARRGPGRPPR